MLENDEINKLIPVLNEDLHFNSLSENEIIVSNRKDKHYLKINKKVYQLLEKVDGKNNLLDIVNIYNKENNVEETVNSVYHLLYHKLISYGILQGFDEEVKPYEKPSYLNLSFIIINERILNNIVKLFVFLFKKRTAIFTVLLCLLLIVIFSYKYFDLYNSFNLKESLLYFFIIMFLSVTFHEIGHATAASYFGAKHGGIGGGFYLFSPVYFADVTDVWRLNKKNRIIVNLSGMYFELIFCTVISLLAFIIKNETLLIVSLIVFFKTFFNLNPFLRSDGYWILSDLTNKPNLLSHSFFAIKRIFSSRGRKSKWTFKDVILFIYGLISYSFMLLFCYIVLIKNPNSIINFPENLYNFVESIFTKNEEFNLIRYGELVIPLVFFMLLFGVVKKIIYSIKRKERNRKHS